MVFGQNGQKWALLSVLIEKDTSVLKRIPGVKLPKYTYTLIHSVPPPFSQIL